MTWRTKPSGSASIIVWPWPGRRTTSLRRDRDVRGLRRGAERRRALRAEQDARRRRHAGEALRHEAVGQPDAALALDRVDDRDAHRPHRQRLERRRVRPQDVAVEDVERALAVARRDQRRDRVERRRGDHHVAGRVERRLVEQRALDAVGARERLHPDQRAVGVAEVADGLADGVDDREDVLDLALQRVGLRRLARAGAAAAAVEQVQREAVGEAVGEVRPARAVPDAAVHGDERRAGADALDAEARAVGGLDLDELCGGHALRVHRVRLPCVSSRVRLASAA